MTYALLARFKVCIRICYMFQDFHSMESENGKDTEFSFSVLLWIKGKAICCACKVL